MKLTHIWNDSIINFLCCLKIRFDNFFSIFNPNKLINGEIWQNTTYVFLQLLTFSTKKSTCRILFLVENVSKDANWCIIYWRPQPLGGKVDGHRFAGENRFHLPGPARAASVAQGLFPGGRGADGGLMWTVRLRKIDVCPVNTEVLRSARWRCQNWRVWHPRVECQIFAGSYRCG